MAPRLTGTVESHRWKDGRTVSWRGRFRAYGERHRIDFGTNHEGWNEQRARNELDRILGEVQRGVWEPPKPEPRRDVVDTGETMHVTASRWWQRRRDELADSTQLDYRWRLDYILEHLAPVVTAAIDPPKVDAFREQLKAAGLSPRSVNMVLDLLAQVLDDAVEYGLLIANPARGKRRRMKVPKSRRTFLEPDMVVDLLEEAGAWERSVPAHQRYGRRALLAVLCLGGPRIGELTGATRARLDMHGGRLRVGESKTAAGLRDIELSAYLLDELRPHLAATSAALLERHGAALPIFHSRTGRELNGANVRNRLLNGTAPQAASGRGAPKGGTKGLVQRVNEKRALEGRMLLPDRVTPHTLRRTYASLALAAGRDPRWVMAQIGHTDARLTLSVYAQVMQRTRVDEALIWQLMCFPDEPEDAVIGPTIGPTRRLAAFR
jgi:integrase